MLEYLIYRQWEASTIVFFFNFGMYYAYVLDMGMVVWWRVCVIPHWHSYLSTPLRLMRKDQVSLSPALSITWLLHCSVLPFWFYFYIIEGYEFFSICIFISTNLLEFKHFTGYTDFFSCLRIDYLLTTVKLITTGVFTPKHYIIYNSFSVPFTLNQLPTWMFLTLQ